MAYVAKDFDHLLGTPGFSETMLKNHFTLYQGYVKNTNATMDTLGAMLKDGKGSTPEFAALSRRFGWEWNGMRLHELYFENMKNGGAGSVPSTIAEKMEEFKAIGAMRSIGWVVLYYDPTTQALMNAWINEHDTGHLSGCTPLLVMDVFEHAYMTDYGIKRVDYIEAFLNAIDWSVVEGRFNKTNS